MTDTRASDAKAEARLSSDFDRYEPAIARLGKALRKKLRDRLPGLSEIVYFYANQDALVISYSPTEKGYEGLFSLGLYPHEAKLFFSQGTQLPDPNKLLQGRAAVRHVVLHKAVDFDRPEIEALIAAALKLAKVRLEAGARGAVIFKAEEQKKRAKART